MTQMQGKATGPCCMAMARTAHADRWNNHPRPLFPLSTSVLQDKYFQMHQMPKIQLSLLHAPSSTGDTRDPILCSVSGFVPSPLLASPFRGGIKQMMQNWEKPFTALPAGVCSLYATGIGYTSEHPPPFPLLPALHPQAAIAPKKGVTNNGRRITDGAE